MVEIIADEISSEQTDTRNALAQLPLYPSERRLADPPLPLAAVRQLRCFWAHQPTKEKSRLKQLILVGDEIDLSESPLKHRGQTVLECLATNPIGYNHFLRWALPARPDLLRYEMAMLKTFIRSLQSQDDQNLGS